MVYLDYNATTPLAPEALEAMLPHLRGNHGNPSSIHAHGRAARAVIDEAREKLADLLGARPHEMIFTSGGTEACNLAVLGLARAHVHRGRHLITAPTEHHAVLHAFEHLQHHEGFEVTLLPVGRHGEIDPDTLAAAIRPDTILASVMHANNETGVIAPVAELASLCREKGVLFHTDAVQSFGKLAVCPSELGVTSLSLAAHKFYGPKGVGAVWLKSGVALTRLAHGGSHENSRRPGTENVASIAGMAAAASLAEDLRESESLRLAPLREELWVRIQRIFPAALRNAGPENTLTNTLNVSFPGLDGEALLIGLDVEGVGASSGSACMVGSLQASHVLLAMGAGYQASSAAIRFSLGRGTSREDIDFCAEALERTIRRQATCPGTAKPLTSDL